MVRIFESRPAFAGAIPTKFEPIRGTAAAGDLDPAAALSPSGDNEKLRMALKRAVSNPHAPEYLINSIRNAIKRG